MRNVRPLYLPVHGALLIPFLVGRYAETGYEAVLMFYQGQLWMEDFAWISLQV